MRTTFFLIGAVALAGAGLVVAASSPQQPAETAAPAAGTAPPKSGFTPEQQAVADAVAAFAKAYSNEDVAGLERQFSDDVVLIDPEGNETQGKQAVATMYANSFQQTAGLKIEPEVADIRLLTPDVARVEGQSRLSIEGGDASEFTRFSALLVRKDGQWKAAEIREYAAPADDVTPYERLKELEWMVGRWVDESDTNKVEADVRWADKQSYLIRTYNVEIQGERSSSGTMFIGWDPQSGQIKSWVFDSEGGHGEALWTRTAPNQWVVKAQGVLRDGRPNSATLIHTIINKDSVKTSSIDRIIGGQVANDILDVVMVRKPPPAIRQAGHAEVIRYRIHGGSRNHQRDGPGPSTPRCLAPEPLQPLTAFEDNHVEPSTDDSCAGATQPSPGRRTGPRPARSRWRRSRRDGTARRWRDGTARWRRDGTARWRRDGRPVRHGRHGGRRRHGTPGNGRHDTARDAPESPSDGPPLRPDGPSFHAREPARRRPGGMNRPNPGGMTRPTPLPGQIGGGNRPGAGGGLPGGGNRPGAGGGLPGGGNRPGAGGGLPGGGNRPGAGGGLPGGGGIGPAPVAACPAAAIGPALAAACPAAAIGPALAAVD